MPFSRVADVRFVRGPMVDGRWLQPTAGQCAFWYAVPSPSFRNFRITLLRVEIGFRVCWFCPRDWVGPTKSGGQVASTTVGDPVGKPPSGCQLPTPRGQCSHGLYYRFSTSLLHRMSTFSNIFSSSCCALDVRIKDLGVKRRSRTRVSLT